MKPNYTTPVESIIQARITRSLREWNWAYFKVHAGHGGTPKGFPDLMVFVPGGRTVMLEVKRPGQSLDPLQRHWVDRLIKDGFAAYVVHDHGHAVRVLRKEYEEAHGQRTRTA